MQIENVEQWIGRDVIDGSGDKIGKLNEVYFRGSQAIVGEIQHGKISKKSHLVPLREASATREELRLPYTADTVHAVGGPANDGTVTTAELAEVSSAYGIHLGDDGGAPLEGTRQREERLEAQDRAAKRADELEEEARHRAADAEDARAKADEAERQAREAEDAQRHAERAAAEARAEAGGQHVGSAR